MRSKIVFLLMFVPLLFITAGLGYLTYSAFMDYRFVQMQSRYLEGMKALNGLLNAIQDEKSVSAFYLGNRGARGNSNLKKTRAHVDALLEKLEKNMPLEKDEKERIGSLKKNLSYVRSSVDAMSGDYKDVFGKGYGKETLSLLIHTASLLVEKFESGETEQEGKTYVAFIRSRSALKSEQAFLNYILLRGKALDIRSIVFWETLMEEEIDPDFQALDNLTLREKLMALLGGDEKTAKLDFIRGEIFEDGAKGNFTLTPEQLGKAFFLPVDAINQGESLLHEEMTKSLLKRLENDRARLIQYGAATLFSLMVLLFFWRALSSSARERRALEETLREMVSDLEIERQNELESILKRGDKVSVYRFLADTTREAREARAEALEAREQAFEAEKAKDLFLANMSHEIRTPLNGIVGFTQLLESTELSDEQKSFVDIIKGSSENLLSIVNSILDLSKIRADKVELEEISFSPIEVFSDAIEPHEVHNAEKKIAYTVFIDPELPVVMGDPTRLRQIMNNLIGNAVKFTDVGGAIDTRIEKVDEDEETIKIRFSVKDTGIGITEEQQEKIFEAFSQADISTTRQFGGTGLGLTITRDLISHMGGELKVKSKVGVGSEFYFVLTFAKKGIDEKYRSRFTDLEVSYFLPRGSVERTFDESMIRYLRAACAKVNIIESIEDDLEGSNILFCDYSLGEVRDNIDRILRLPVKIVLSGYLSYKDEIDSRLRENVTVLYRPVTYPKVLKALEQLGGKSVRQQETAVLDAGPVFDGMNILVAEDNHINQKLIRALLESLGVEVTIAENGKKALELRRNGNFDLILMDIQMPVMGGVESTQKILQYEKENAAAHIPIVALTANALRGDREKYLKAGMDEYLSKPIDIDRLKEILSSFAKSSFDKKNLSKEYETETTAINPSDSVFADDIPDTKSSVRDSGAEIDEFQELSPDKTDREWNRHKSIPVNDGTTDDEETTEKAEIAFESEYTPNEISDRTSGDEIVIERGDILLLTRSGLMSNLHRKFFTVSDIRMEIVDNIDEFLHMVERKIYRYMIIDPLMLNEEICIALEVLRELGTEVMSYKGLTKDLLCFEALDIYESAGELRHFLKTSR